MILKDNNIVLRAIEEKDAPVLLEMINSPEIERSVVGYSYPVSMEQQKKWIQNLGSVSDLRYAIDSGSGMIGVATITALDFKNGTGNVNIKILETERGKRYATYALRLLIVYCFHELNLNCLYANILENNQKSRNLFESLGFKLDGIMRQRIYKNNQYNNLCAYSFLRTEFNERDWK